MKQVAILSVVVALAGCAGLPGQHEPPHYNYAQQALVGEGYPVERVNMPLGFELADIMADVRSQQHDTPGDTRSARITEAGVSWVSRDADTAIATALHQGLGQGSYWQPGEESDGYEFIGKRRFQYLNQKGRYDEVGGDSNSIPRSAPECAAATYLVTKSTDRQRRTVLTFTEGLPCGQLAQFGERDAEAQRQRAYQAFGLR